MKRARPMRATGKALPAPPGNRGNDREATLVLHPPGAPGQLNLSMAAAT